MVQRLAIFDFDGPISDTRTLAKEGFQESFSNEGIEIDLSSIWDRIPLLPQPRILEEVQYNTGTKISKASQKRVCEHVHIYISNKIVSSGKLQENIASFLKCVTKLEYKVCIISNRREEQIKGFLEHHGLQDQFEFVIGKDTFTDVAKPDPETVTRAIEKIFGKEVSTLDVLYIGDTASDYSLFTDARRLRKSEGEWAYYHAEYSGEPASLSYSAADYRVRSSSALKTVSHKTRNEGFSSAEDVLEEHIFPILSQPYSLLCGAGISVPSGYGNWDAEYSPILQETGVGPIAEKIDTLEAISLAAADEENNGKIREFFSNSFINTKTPNSYHFSMLRMRPSSIWTLNYDHLFEEAIKPISQQGFKVFREPKDLHKSYDTNVKVIKLHGDFASAGRFGEEGGAVLLGDQMQNYHLIRPEFRDTLLSDYRGKRFLFAGISFNDPVLKQIISNAAFRSSDPHRHLFLDVYKPDPLGRYYQKLRHNNLEALGIRSVCVKSYSALQDVFSMAAMKVQKPVIGFAGNAHVEDGAGAEIDLGNFDPVNKDLASDISRGLGKRLAMQEFRVASCCGPYVGRDAVDEAYKVKHNLARYFLRRGGGKMYKQLDPEIIRSKSGDYEGLHDEFTTALCLLFVIGGEGYKRPEGAVNLEGTIVETTLAVKKQIPVLIFPQAGGHAKHLSEVFERDFIPLYKEVELREKLTEANNYIRSLESFSEAALTSITKKAVDLVKYVYSAPIQECQPHVAPTNW